MRSRSISAPSRFGYRKWRPEGLKSDPMSFDAIKINSLAPALGAEIGGVDLSGDLSDGVIAGIRQALLDHLVVFFRDQDITPEQHLSFAGRFGEK